MGWAISLLLLLLVLISAVVAFMAAPAPAMAGFLRRAGPVALIVIGAGLALAGRVGIGITLALAGASWFMRKRAVSSGAGSASGRRSTVRSAMLEMALDHDSGEMEGLVLTGVFEGRRLSSLSDADLLRLHRQTIQDPESAALLESYLDRRIPRWRENAKADAGGRKAEAARSGAMTKEEAYQILGLEAGASAKDIREAHRRLMKRIHPDSGGSTFLAAKINEAKDTLID